MIGFDNGIVCVMCKVRAQNSPKLWNTIRANKVARGLLSPFQMKEFQLAYAVA